MVHLMKWELVKLCWLLSRLQSQLSLLLQMAQYNKVCPRPSRHSDTPSGCTMKTLGGALLLAALLSLCRGVSAEKNGSCPLPPSYPTCETFQKKPLDECSTDYQCTGDAKCCEYGCSMKCKEPLQDKLGSCPNFNSSICLYSRPAPAECSTDNQCQGTERCCCAGACRRQCEETVNNQYCVVEPENEDYCGNLPSPSCDDDSDCDSNKHCCMFDGQVQCV